MRLVFAGTPTAAVPALEALLASRHEVAAVVTRPDAPAGRGRRLGASPVAERAAEAGLEILKPAKARDPEFLERLRSKRVDPALRVRMNLHQPRLGQHVKMLGSLWLPYSNLVDNISHGKRSLQQKINDL